MISCSLTRRHIVGCVRAALACALGFGLTACTPGATVVDVWFNNVASLGRPIDDEGNEDDRAGLRGDIDVVLVNNTAYRAVFTFGTYDPLNTDQDGPVRFPIKFLQFFVDPDNAGNRLDAFSESEVLTFIAGQAADPGGRGRAMSIGHRELIELIESNEIETSANGSDLHEEALRPVCDYRTSQPGAGIAFFAETSAGPAADACESADELVGWAEGIVTLQGASYPCNARLIYTFQEDGTWPDGKKKFRVELTQVILP